MWKNCMFLSGYGLETKGDGFMFGLPEKNQNKKGGTETHKHGNLMNENPGGTKQRIIGQVDAPDKIIDEDVKPLSTPPTAGVTPTTPTSLSDDNECICEKKMRRKVHNLSFIFVSYSSGILSAEKPLRNLYKFFAG